MPALIASCFGAIACGPPPIYQQPDPNEPHAILKVRVTHHATLPTTLDELMTLAGYTLPAPGPGELAPRHFLRAYRVEPGPQTLQVRTHFYHTVTTPRTEHYNDTERYQCGTTRSGIGTSSYSSPQYCTRSVPRTRTVYDTRTITDALCERGASINFPPGAVYFVEYDFYGHDQCSVRCMQQVADGRGGFSLSPCPPVVVAD